MDYRKNYILSKLSTNGTVMSSELISYLDISERTLRNEIKELNRMFKERMIVIDNGKVIVNNMAKFSDFSKKIIENSDLSSYKLSKSERMVLELLIISFSNKYVTVDELCNILLFSRQTILNDLKRLRSDLSKSGIKLISITNHGFTIQSDEKNICKMLLKVLCDTKYRSVQFLNKEVEALLYENVDLDKFSCQLLKYTDEHHIDMSDDLFNKALILLIVTVKRLANRKNTRSNNLSTTGLLYNCLISYDSSATLYESENKAFFDELDKLLSPNVKEKVDVNTTSEQMKIASFIWKVCQDFDIITLFGYENYRNLYNHIALTLKYLSEKKNITVNPFCLELKEKYPEIFQSIENNIFIIQGLVDREIDENDISYMAMHIASVIEGRKPNFSSLSTVIVCPTGRCSSLLLKARILKYFDLTVKEVLPSYKVNEDLDVDFIISTVPLESKNVPVIHINQMLLQSDIDRIEREIDKISSKREQNYILDDIQDYLDKYQNIISNNSSNFEKKLIELNQEYEVKEDKKDKDDFLYFYKALEDSHIQLDAEVVKWDKSIEMAGNLLLKDNYLTQKYIDTMISIVKENGPYIVFAPGFVIAHAGPEDGAIKLGVSVVRFKEPIDFGVEEVKVRFVICLSIPNKSSHVFLLFQIYKCFCNEEIYKYLLEAKNSKEFMQILKIFELKSNE